MSHRYSRIGSYRYTDIHSIANMVCLIKVIQEILVIISGNIIYLIMTTKNKKRYQSQSHVNEDYNIN